jgi:hypothetical protein
MSTPVVLLKKFQTLQADRVHNYKIFEDGFQVYLATAPNYDFPKYQQLVHQVTEDFKRLSLDIIDIMNQLSSCAPLLSKYISRIQEFEQTKLEQTAHLQIARQNVIDRPLDTSCGETVEELKQQLKRTTEDINNQLDELKFEAEDILCSDAAS